MQLDAHARIATPLTKRFVHQFATAVIERDKRIRADAIAIRFVKYNCTARTHMFHQQPQHRYRITLKQEYVAANDRIEGTVELHLGGIASVKVHIANCSHGSSL